MEELEKRKQAIAMYLSNHKVSEICRNLDKSRPWFYKWRKRFEQDPKGAWYLDHSSVPHNIRRSYTKEQEALVIKIRKRLEDTLYAQIGAISIQWEMEKLNIPPLPVWTIDRIIKQNGLKKIKPSLPKRKNEYPDYSIAYTHELDLVGPRYLKDSEKYYFCNIIDTNTHCVNINVDKNKKTEFMVKSVVRFWKEFGIPDFLQMDNELSFRGSNRHPHHFGRLIRLALSLGVVPVFIPQAEPWRNGIIEKFNNTFDKKFFRTQKFESYQHLIEQSKKFESFHNNNYRYSAHNNRTPKAVHSEQSFITYLDEDYEIPENIPLNHGEIIVIRFIRSNRQLNIFGKTFLLKKELVYKYVEAKIWIQAQALKIYSDDQLVQEFPYYVPMDWV